MKTGLVLDAVAKAEGLEVTDEEISAAVAQMAIGRPHGRQGVRRPAAQERQDARPSDGRSCATRRPTSSPPTLSPLTEGAAAVAEPKEAPGEGETAKAAEAGEPGDREADSRRDRGRPRRAGEPAAEAAEAGSRKHRPRE